MFGTLIAILNNRRIRRLWRKKNSHNGTIMGNNFNIDLVTVGKYTYGEINILNFSDIMRVSIGNYCSIASNVYFAVCSEHNLNTVSSFPFKAKCLYTQANEAGTKGNIIVDDDVWIGQGAIILSGVHISQGAVVGAGAIVTKDVPPYSIVAGNPAKVLKYRFEEEIIDDLLKIDFGKLDKDEIEKHIQDLYKPLYNVEQLDWLPKK